MSTLVLKRRGIALGVSVVLAVLATLVLVSYVRGLETKALDGVETATVFVAKEDIPPNTPAEVALSRGLIERVSVPRKLVGATAIRSLSEIKGKVSSVTILKGEQILAPRFVTTYTAIGVLPIPAGRQAISVEAEAPSVVGGFVHPGDHVSIIAKLRTTARASGVRVSRAVRSNETISVVKFLLQDVPVLAVGQAVAGRQAKEDEDSDRARQSRHVLLTLAVSREQAEKLTFALLEGDIYFTLLPQGQRPARTPGRTASTLFS